MVVKEVIRPLSSSLHYVHHQQQKSSKPSNRHTKPSSTDTSETSSFSTKVPTVKGKTKQKTANKMQEKTAPQKKKSTPIPSADLTVHSVVMTNLIATTDPITIDDDNERTPIGNNKSSSHNKLLGYKEGTAERTLRLPPPSPNKESFGNSFMKVCTRTIPLCHAVLTYILRLCVIYRIAENSGGRKLW